MNARAPNTPPKWLDPDDAPELTDEDFARGTWQIGDKVVSREEAQTAARELIRRGRPPLTSPKLALTVRYDADVVAAFKATGRGWQTRMNAALRDWLKSHSPA
ncbi:MAG: BrnA antitoxin family protein [Rhodocyclaceae bacterium]|nr:BrnA antitoxin family protein [Rhodocyclaceae bacterium]MDP1957589.1 BrnA antitoxin family protein [Rhodocyclaceae bacterium]